MRNRKASLWIIGFLAVGAVLILTGDVSESKIASQGRTAIQQPASFRGAAKHLPDVPRQKLIESYGKLPLSFEPCVEANCGDTGGEARFLSRGPGYTLFLTATEAVLALRRSQESEARPALSEAEGSQNPSRDRKGEGPVRDSRLGIRDSGFPDRESRFPSPDSSTVLRMKLVGANPAPRITGIEPLPGKSNYFLGNDPAKWCYY